MLLFLKVLATIFIAELGDKSQLLIVAMSSKYKIRDIIIGIALAITSLNIIAVLIGSALGEYLPTTAIKFVAATAFLYFALSSLAGEEDDEDEVEVAKIDCNKKKKEEKLKNKKVHALAVTGAYFIAELGDKTQLSAITFAADAGLQGAVAVFLGSSFALFSSGILALVAGYYLSSKLPAGAMGKVSFLIFAVFGILTYIEAFELLEISKTLVVLGTVGVSCVFGALCVITVLKSLKAKKSQASK